MDWVTLLLALICFLVAYVFLTFSVLLGGVFEPRVSIASSLLRLAAFLLFVAGIAGVAMAFGWFNPAWLMPRSDPAVPNEPWQIPHKEVVLGVVVAIVALLCVFGAIIVSWERRHDAEVEAARRADRGDKS